MENVGLSYACTFAVVEVFEIELMSPATVVLFRVKSSSLIDLLFRFDDVVVDDKDDDVTAFVDC